MQSITIRTIDNISPLLDRLSAAILNAIPKLTEITVGTADDGGLVITVKPSTNLIEFTEWIERIASTNDHTV